MISFMENPIYKWMIWEYPHFRKHPYGSYGSDWISHVTKKVVFWARKILRYCEIPKIIPQMTIFRYRLKLIKASNFGVLAVQ